MWNKLVNYIHGVTTNNKLEEKLKSVKSLVTGKQKKIAIYLSIGMLAFISFFFIFFNNQTPSPIIKKPDNPISVFQVAALGKIDLVASGLEVYNHYSTYLDNIRLKQAYHVTLNRIQNKIPKQYKYEKSIYAMSDSLFDAHIAETENYINKNINNALPLPKKERIELPNSIQSLFTKLESNIDFVCTLRGRLIRFKSKNYLHQIKDVLYQTISPNHKAHVIELLTSYWYGWVKKRYKDESILVNECLSMASALATKVGDQ